MSYMRFFSGVENASKDIPYVKNWKEYTTSARQRVGRCVFNGIMVKSTGTAITFTIYDGVNTSGRLLTPTDFQIGPGTGLTMISLVPGLLINTDVYVSMSGVGSYMILYDN